MNNFVPKKKKYKKYQKGKSFNKVAPIHFIDTLKVGSIGLKALNHSRLDSKQLNSMVKSIKKLIKKTGKLYLKVFPQNPITNKPVEVRMGKGKGTVCYWVAKIKLGCILCEIETKKPKIAIKALNNAQIKLPFKTRIFISK